MIKQLKTVATTAQEHGITLTVENVGHQSKGFPLSVVGEMATAAGVPMCFDIGHAYMEGGNDAIERVLETHADQIDYLHVHDVRTRGDTHLPLGAGEIDFELIAERWSAIEAQPTLEIFTDDRAHLIDSRDRLSDLLAPSA